VNGLILETIVRGLGNEGKGLDLKIKNAKHGDFMCEKINETLIHPVDNKFIYSGMKLVGLISNSEIQNRIHMLIISFCKTILFDEDLSYPKLVSSYLENNYIEVKYLQSNEVPDLIKNIPSYML